MSKTAPTEDIHPNWLNIIRAIQATCVNNNGLAVISVSVGVDGNEPTCWFEPEISRIHPMRLAKAKMTPRLATTFLMMTAHKNKPLPIPVEANTIE